MSHTPFPAVKLKGVGIWNPEHAGFYSGVHQGEIWNEAHPPTTVEYAYTSQTQHFGITNEGEYTLLYSEAAPFGGITYNRASQEYTNGLRLFAQGVCVTVPFLVVQYHQQWFNGQKLGAVVSFLPDCHPFRLHLMLFDRTKLPEDQQRFVNRVYRSFGRNTDNLSYTDQIRVISCLYQQYGQVLRDFAEAGFYRHSGGLDNVYYQCENTRVFLTDFDSSRALQEVPAEVRPLQILRDFSSVLFKFFSRLCRTDLLHVHQLAVLRAYDPLYNALSGFFPDVEQSLIENVSHSCWDYFAPAFNVLQNKDPLHNMRLLACNATIERDFFFILAMTKMYGLYVKSSINKIYPLHKDYSDMLHKSQTYLKERYSLLCKYL